MAPARSADPALSWLRGVLKDTAAALAPVLSFPLMRNSQRVAVVTGGAGAIGGAIATALAAAGHTVVSLADLDLDLTAWRHVQAVNVEAALLPARALAGGHGRDGIAVTCVAPGLTDTPAARAGQPAALFDAVRSRQALPRTLVPGDVAATVAFLASDGAAALTGQTLCIDGGLVLR